MMVVNTRVRTLFSQRWSSYFSYFKPGCVFASCDSSQIDETLFAASNFFRLFNSEAIQDNL